MKTTQSGFIHNLFLLFIIVVALAFAAIPDVRLAFKQTSQDLSHEYMRRLESEALLYFLDKGTYNKLCSNAFVSVANIRNIHIPGDGISCQTSSDGDDFVMFTKIDKHTYLCIDNRINGVHTIFSLPFNMKC